MRSSTRVIAVRGTDEYNKTYFIGEKFFIIYYPVLEVVCSGKDGFHTFMVDGINRNLLGESEGKKPAGLKSDTGSYQVKLLTHRCKNCGHDLKAADFDVIYYCNSCFRLWLLKEKDYESIKKKVLEAKNERNLVYIPFWRFIVEMRSEKADITIKSVGDLSKLMKMGDMILRKEDPEKPVTLYVPAIVTRNANAVIKLATRISSVQKDIPLSKTEEFPFDRVINSSLPEKEAEEMLNVLVFSVIGRADRRCKVFYQDLKIDIKEKELVWYPFGQNRNYYTDHYNNYNFPKRSMNISAY